MPCSLRRRIWKGSELAVLVAGFALVVVTVVWYRVRVRLVDARYEEWWWEQLKGSAGRLDDL